MVEPFDDWQQITISFVESLVKMSEKLSGDNQQLLVINCAKTWQEVERERVYICPAEQGSYNHKPSRYFGLYRTMKVSHVANIEAVVKVFPDETTQFEWITGGGREQDYQQKALTYALNLRPRTDLPVKVFILGILQETDFKKDTRGSMQGSKQYIDVSKLNVDSAGFLAMKLRGKTWADF